jgi:hypothetical protein
MISDRATQFYTSLPATNFADVLVARTVVVFAHPVPAKRLAEPMPVFFHATRPLLGAAVTGFLL